MNRRTWTLLTSVVLVVAFGLLGAFVRVPYVALGPGPTYDTLGTDGQHPVIRIDGLRTFPTGGHLNMTTVSVTDQLSMFAALGMWASGKHALAPREIYFPPYKSEQQIEQDNTKAFNTSQNTAETAALRHLGYPVKVVVAEIVKQGPASGILEPGDRLISAGGRPLENPEALRAAVAGKRPGERIQIQFQRGDQLVRTEGIQLVPRPHSPQEGFLGVAATEQPDVNFNIDISLADVGGPSAGLMFSLAIIDKLTPGQLNGGQFVAGTGEINPGGQVGPIGGIPFKMIEARQSGASTFLVPAGNCAEARAQTPEGMQLARVATLGDAIEALEALRAGKSPAGC